MKIKYKGTNGVNIRSLSPVIKFDNIKTGDALEVTEEQAEQLLRNPDFEKVGKKGGEG